MEEVEKQFIEKCAISMVFDVSMLVDEIRKKLSNKNNPRNLPEIPLLNSFCVSKSRMLADSACQALVALVEEGLLDTTGTLSDLCFYISTAKSFEGIICAIDKIMKIDKQLKLVEGRQSASSLTKHPFIMIIKKNASVWKEVWNQMHFSITEDEDRFNDALELYESMFYFIFCSPKDSVAEMFVQECWSLLVKLDHDTKLVRRILLWRPTNTEANLERTISFYLELVDAAATKKNDEFCFTLLPTFAYFAKLCMQKGGNAMPCFATLSKFLSGQNPDYVHDIVSLILCEILAFCPLKYLCKTLSLCKSILSYGKCRRLVLNCIKAAVLQWIAYPSFLVSDSLVIAKEIMSEIEDGKISRSYSESNFNLNATLNNSGISIYINILNTMSEDEGKLHETLEQIATISAEKKHELLYVFLGLLVEGFGDKRIPQLVMQIALDSLQFSKNGAQRILTVIYSRLPNETNPLVQKCLLNAIPRIAAAKGNISHVLRALDTLSKEEQLRAFTLKLYMDLWLIQNRCYPNLMDKIGEPIPSFGSEEYLTMKAFVLKKICEESPINGKQCVMHLSNILNKCQKMVGSTASAFALDGITTLCRAGIADIYSTWQVLATTVGQDERPLVLQSVCDLLSNVPSLKAVSEQYEALKSESVTQLWQYLLRSNSFIVKKAAAKALCRFSTEEMEYASLPAECKHFPVQTEVEDNFDVKKWGSIIPGECWLKLLQNCGNEAVRDLLTAWVHREIADYRKKTYSIAPGKGEPANYSYLPPKSILAALGNFVQVQSSSTYNKTANEKSVINCLEVLSQTYPKPLPPLNWTFLHELFHWGPDVQKFCVIIAAKQLLISGSAKRFTENYVNGFRATKNNINEVETLFSVLTYLCAHLRPDILRGFMNSSLDIASELAIQGDLSLLSCITSALQKTLNEEINEKNQYLIGQSVEYYAEKFEKNDLLLDTFLPCIVYLPDVFARNVSAPNSLWNTRDEKMKFGIKIRCGVAKVKQTMPLEWLNDILDSASTKSPEMQRYALKMFCETFRHHKSNESNPKWLLGLMGKIQADIVANIKPVNAIQFECQVYIAILLISSDLMCVTRNDTELELNIFPTAVEQLLSKESWICVTKQTMEWLYYMTDCSKIPEEFRLTFMRALCACKHTEEYRNSIDWMKYVAT